MKLKVVLSVLVALVAVLIFAAGSTNVVRAEEHTVPAGHDLFETDEEETYQDLFLPAGFFPGCDVFSGRVFFEGDPFDSFGAFNGLSPTDTIVERLGNAEAPFPTEGQTIDIEIVRLELVSVAPLTITGCAGGDQSWELRAQVPEGDTKQTTGTMTITHQGPNGGRFTSLLPVDPLLTFHRVDEPAADIGPTYLSDFPGAGGPLNFVAEGPWCNGAKPLDEPEGAVVVEVPGLNGDFFPGIICPDNPGQGGPGNPGAGKRIKCLTKEQAKRAAHGILPSENPPLNHYDDKPLPCPGKVGGITEIVVHDSNPRSEGSGSGTDSTVPIATAAAGIALALLAGGWFVRRRLIRRA